MGAHGAVASFLFDEAKVAAVLENWQTADIDPKLRAMLAFLEKMALRPDELDAAALQQVLAAGVTPAGVRDAAYVCAMFSTITRLADALVWDVPDSFASSRVSLVKFGYRLPPGL